MNAAPAPVFEIKCVIFYFCFLDCIRTGTKHGQKLTNNYHTIQFLIVIVMSNGAKKPWGPCGGGVTVHLTP